MQRTRDTRMDGVPQRIAYSIPDFPSDRAKPLADWFLGPGRSAMVSRANREDLFLYRDRNGKRGPRSATWKPLLRHWISNGVLSKPRSQSKKMTAPLDA